MVFDSRLRRDRQTAKGFMVVVIVTFFPISVGISS